MEKYGLYDAIEMIDEVVRGHESHVYKKHSGSGLSCHYAWDGQPDCIVGHVLVKVGVTVESLEYGESREVTPGKYAMGDASEVLELLRKDGIVEFDDDAQMYLTRVQYHQDDETPWGEAAKLGREYVRGMIAGRRS